jgi:hypothetical protein
MTCPKCQSPNAEPTLGWTISGRRLTLPQLRLWACQNLECRYQWPREHTSPIVISVKDTPSDTQTFPHSCG